jgi:putative oxidoreductase
MRAITDPLARILIVAIFVYTGITKLMHFDSTSHMIAEKGIPLAAVATVIAILIELGGAIAIIIGWQTKLAAIAQIAYLILITFLYHNFWAAPPQLHDVQLINFLRNVAMMGGLLLLATRGAGASAADSAPSHS